MDFILIVPVLLFSIVVHEVAHAWVAYREGDDTAYKLGRITLNPIPHIDPVGSILVPAALYYFGGGMLFGWAKPVPVIPRNYRNYRLGDIRVSMAGIVANLALALISAVLLVLIYRLGGAAVGGAGILATLAAAVHYGLYINLILAWFNLIPLPPLDGSHVLYHLLPPGLGARYRALGRYGVTVLFGMVVIFPSAIGMLLAPVEIVRQWILSIAVG
ncbi:MAG: site-2 protease family protein [Longimicrobiales bacterium]